jgi:hypothetical protein
MVSTLGNCRAENSTSSRLHVGIPSSYSTQPSWSSHFQIPDKTIMYHGSSIGGILPVKARQILGAYC